MATTESSPHLPDRLHRLADEIRVRLHLAGMEAKDAWAKLEPRLSAFQRRAEQAGEKIVGELKHVGSELEAELKKLRRKIES